MLRKEIDEKKLKGNLYDIVKDLRSKFDVEQKKAWAQKDVGKRQEKKGDIFTITRPRKGCGPHETRGDIEVLSRSILNITFSLEDPRTPNCDPKDPLPVISYIHQMKVHRVYIDSVSSTDILYK